MVTFQQNPNAFGGLSGRGGYGGYRSGYRGVPHMMPRGGQMAMPPFPHQAPTFFGIPED